MIKDKIYYFVGGFIGGLSGIVLRKYNPYIIAVTGSAGKTTVKYTIGKMLMEVFPSKQVRIGYGNLNSLAGVPLSVFDIQVADIKIYYWILLAPFIFIKFLYIYLIGSFPKYFVCEIGADRESCFEKITKYIKPDISIVTNIGPTHLEIFKTLEKIKLEKETLVKNTKKDGLVILNGRDSLVRKMKESFNGRVVLLESTNANFAQDCALQVAKELAVDSDQAKKALENSEIPKRRMDILNGKNQTVIIDSTYNANPLSMNFAFEKLLEIARGRKIIVLGDMLELGKDSEKYHKEIGSVARSSSDYLVTVGERFKVAPADYQASDTQEAADHLLSIIRPGDTILLKASNGMHFDKITKKLIEI